MSIKTKLIKLNDLVKNTWQYNVSSHWQKLPYKSVQLVVTYQCNSRCVMCNIWKMKPKNEFTLLDWQKTFQDPLFQQIEYCNLTGGEIFLYPDLIKLIKLILRSYPSLKKISLVSNGLATSLVVTKTVQIAKLCHRYGVNLSVGISLDGVDQTHNQVRGVKDAFIKASATLLSLQALSKKYNFWVGSGSLVLRSNIDKVDEIVKWYQEHRVNYSFQIVGFHSSYVNNFDTKKKVDFGKQEQKSLIKFLEKEAKAESWRDVSSYYWRDLLAMYRDGCPRTTPCPFQKNQFSIDSFGRVYYCLSTKSIGSLTKDGSVSQILFNDKNLKFKEQMKKTSCLKCNSGCDVKVVLREDLKRYLWFRLTGKLWYGFKKHQCISK